MYLLHQIERERDRERERQREIDRQTDRQTESETDIGKQKIRENVQSIQVIAQE